MKKSLLVLICCPEDRSPFTLSKPLWRGDEIISGELRCSTCGVAYPVADGVPVILKSDIRSCNSLRFSQRLLWAARSRNPHRGLPYLPGC